VLAGSLVTLALAAFFVDRCHWSVLNSTPTSAATALATPLTIAIMLPRIEIQAAARMQWELALLEGEISEQSSSTS